MSRIPEYQTLCTQSTSQALAAGVLHGLQPELCAQIGTKSCLALADGSSADKPPILMRLTFGGIAGVVAQTFTYPLDVVRRSMQVS